MATACFLHIIGMMALESSLLEIRKTINSNSISLWKSKNSLSWRVESGWGVTAFLRVLVHTVLQKGIINTQYKATGHTNLFFNLFYFSSKLLCRHKAQENKPHFGSTQSPSISKSSWVLPKYGSFSCSACLQWCFELKQNRLKNQFVCPRSSCSFTLSFKTSVSTFSLLEPTRPKSQSKSGILEMWRSRPNLK